MRMVRRALSILSLLASLLCAHDWAFAQVRPGIRAFVAAPEGCSIVDPVDTEDLFSFIKAQIGSLSFAREGEKVDRDVLAAAYGPPKDRMNKAFVGLRQERINNMCASFLVAPYAGSKNASVAAPAKILTEGYDELSKMTDQLLKINMLETMQRKSGGSSPSYRELSSMTKRRKELMEKMTESLDASLALVIDPRRMDAEGKPDHLIFTHGQTEELLTLLHSRFPNLQLEKTSTRAGDFVKHAALIESFLSGKYKPADR